MEKKIEDYLHLYLGCDVQIAMQPNGILGAVGIANNTRVIVRWPGEDEWSYADVSEIKPILRPFSSATDSEILELNRQHHQFDTGNPASHITTDWAYKIDWLIKKRFDVFGLIPAGLAIDATLTPISSTTIKP